MTLATEDELSEAIGAKMISNAGLQMGQCLRKEGNGYLRKRLSSFCQMAANNPVLVITDLDTTECPIELINKWRSGIQLPTSLLFRIAIREVESWLLADADGLASFLAIKQSHIPLNPESLHDPKGKVLELAARSRRSISKEMIRKVGGRLYQGLGYNHHLCEFVRSSWNIDVAAARAPSLGRAINRLAAI